MRHLITFVLVASLLVLESGFAEAESCSVRMGDPGDVDYQYLTRWNNLYIESERLEKTKEGKSYAHPMLEAHNSFFIKLMEKCQAEARKSGKSMFMAIAIVSKSGVIEQYMTYPRKAEYQCFVNGVVGQTYPSPPADHYPVGFVVLFDNPIGSPDEACVRQIYGNRIDKMWSTPNPAFKHGSSSVAH